MTHPRESILGRYGRSRTATSRVVSDINDALAAKGLPPMGEASTAPLRLGLWGQYNAGKSTLANALLNEARAVTGDAPETKEPHDYDYGAYVLVDLPGGNAREEERRAALAALATADVVIYVVSSESGLDAEATWLDLEALEAARVPYLLVINDKKAAQTPAEHEANRSQVLGTFFTHAARRLAGHSWQGRVFWVRARTAALKRAEGNHAFDTSSGIAAFEAGLLHFLARSDEHARQIGRLNAGRARLRELEAVYAAELDATAAGQYARALTRVDEARERLAAAAALVSSEHFGPLADVIESRLTRAIRAQGERGEAEREVTEGIESALANAAAAFANHVAAEVAAVGAVLDEPVTPAGAPAEPFHIALGTVPEVAAAVDGVKSALGDITRTLSVLTGDVIAAAAPAVGQHVLRQGAEVAASALAKRGAKKAASGLRILGPAIDVAQGAWDIYKSFEAAARERDAYQAAVKEVHAKSALAAGTVTQTFLGRANLHVATALAPLARALREALRATADGQSAVAAQLKVVERLTSECERCLADLEHRIYEAPRDF